MSDLAHMLQELRDEMPAGHVFRLYPGPNDPGDMLLQWTVAIYNCDRMFTLVACVGCSDVVETVQMAINRCRSFKVAPQRPKPPQFDTVNNGGKLPAKKQAAVPPAKKKILKRKS